VKRETPIAEWIVALIGATTVVATMGFLAYDAAYGTHTAPELGVHVLAIERLGDTFRVQIRVANNGGQTAAQVMVYGEVLEGGRPVEHATASLDYVAAGSHADGALIFTTDPRSHTLNVRALGYRVP
jgi:uncharacterized protein (TIGR02588 family)